MMKIWCQIKRKTTIGLPLSKVKNSRKKSQKLSKPSTKDFMKILCKRIKTNPPPKLLTPSNKPTPYQHKLLRRWHQSWKIKWEKSSSSKSDYFLKTFLKWLQNKNFQKWTWTSWWKNLSITRTIWRNCSTSQLNWMIKSNISEA